jgi:YidC/Oxa1 family membrane protein insertase
VSLFDTIIVQPILNLLLAIYSLIPGGDFGISIIIFTIIVRFAMWPLLKKQLHQTRSMQKLQPQMAKIKKECKGNKQLEGIRMMELYKEYGVSPFRSIGILLLQLPIFIALYRVIRIIAIDQDSIGTYTYGFLKGVEPIAKLIENPASLNQKLFGFIDLAGQAISQDETKGLVINIVLLILALVAVGTQFILSKQITPKNVPKRRFKDIMSEASSGKEVDQAELNAITTKNMTNIMPIMMLFIMVYLPGAITLYYLASNAVAILQQRNILKQDSEEMIQIAEELPSTEQKVGKKATAKARAKAAQEGSVIRIVAKDNHPKKKK